MSKLGRHVLKALTEAAREGKSTWNLYKDEPFLERVSMVLYTCDLLDPLFKAYYSVRTFFANIKRLIDYAPLVWQHRNWDYGFILRFQVKLHEDLYKGIFVDGHHVFTKKDTAILRSVINAFKRLEADDYDSKSWKYLEKKYGKDDIYFVKIEGTEEKPGGPYSSMRSKREDRLTKRQKEAYSKDRQRLWKQAEEEERQDLIFVGKMIAEYSKKWWD